MTAMYHAEVPESVQIRTPHPVSRAEIEKIREWLPWSIINLFIGWGFGGLLPLILSILCRYNKRANDWKGARITSTLALIFNILATLGGIAGWIALTIILVYARRWKTMYAPK